MKAFVFFVFLLIPMCLKAQENLLGKTRCDINIAFQNAEAPRINSNALDGAPFSDAFLSGKDQETICKYDHMEICTEVIKIVKIHYMPGIINAFNSNYDKGEDNIFLTNVWFDKDKVFKVHLENWTGIGWFYLDYLSFDRGFVRR